MKIAVSNIAWTANEEPQVAKALQDAGIKYVEIAPTKVWADPLNASDAQIAEYKKFWAGYDIKIVAFQSMLFGRLDLTIFDDEKTRQETLSFLKKFINLAGRIGAEVLVFGSPKNRQRKGLSKPESNKIATDFFRELGNFSEKNNTLFCIEPNAPDYECDFVTTAKEGLALVEAVNNPGFKLHLDAACMTMAKEDLYESITKSRDSLKHFHISAPFLQPIEETEVNHKLAAQALKNIGYDRFVSIEMRPGDEGQNVERVKNAVEIAKKYYA